MRDGHHDRECTDHPAEPGGTDGGDGGVYCRGVCGGEVQRSQGAATDASGTAAWSMTGAGKSRVSDPAYLAG